MDIHDKLLVVPPVCDTALFTTVLLSLAASLPDRKILSGLERLVSLPPFSVCLPKTA